MLLSLVLIMSISMILPMMLTPISLGIWIIILATLSAMMLSMLISSWFGFILLLLYIGGLLVMFAYFVAITPNNKIYLMDPLLAPIMCLLALSLLTTNFKTLTFLNFSLVHLPKFTTLISMNLLPLLIIMAITLLLILISVVKITKRSQGTFRPFM